MNTQLPARVELGIPKLDLQFPGALLATGMDEETGGFKLEFHVAPQPGDGLEAAAPTPQSFTVKTGRREFEQVTFSLLCVCVCVFP